MGAVKWRCLDKGGACASPSFPNPLRSAGEVQKFGVQGVRVKALRAALFGGPVLRGPSKTPAAATAPEAPGHPPVLHPQTCSEPTMKAISPVRSVRSCYEAVCCLSEQSLAIARGSHNKSPALEEPMNLLYDMNDCYSKLRELVPGIPQGTKVSQVEILQHVIDYIFDLQIVLEEGSKGRDPSSEATLLSLKVRVSSDWGLGFSIWGERMC